MTHLEVVLSYFVQWYYEVTLPDILSAATHFGGVTDYGTRRGRSSTSSSSAFGQPSSSHHNDDDAGNDEETSRASTPSPTRVFCEEKLKAKEIRCISAKTSQESAFDQFPIRRINLPPYAVSSWITDMAYPKMDMAYLRIWRIRKVDMAYPNLLKKIMEYFIHGAYAKQIPIRRIEFQYAVMDDPDITMEEYIQLMADKARGRDQTFNWETTTYGEVYCEDLDCFTDFETNFPAIVYNDASTSNQNVSSEPTVSIYNGIKSDIDFHISFSNSEDEDYTFIYNKDLSSYKLVPIIDLKLEPVNDHVEIKTELCLENINIKPTNSVVCISNDTTPIEFDENIETNHDTPGNGYMKKDKTNTKRTKSEHGNGKRMKNPRPKVNPSSMDQAGPS
ncbi:zf-CCHC domain-containing protein [Tanacetum coccineum]